MTRGTEGSGPEGAERQPEEEPGHDRPYPDDEGGDPRSDAQKDAADVGGE